MRPVVRPDFDLLLPPAWKLNRRHIRIHDDHALLSRARLTRTDAKDHPQPCHPVTGQYVIMHLAGAIPGSTGQSMGTAWASFSIFGQRRNAPNRAMLPRQRLLDTPVARQEAAMAGAR